MDALLQAADADSGDEMFEGELNEYDDEISLGEGEPIRGGGGLSSPGRGQVEEPGTDVRSDEASGAAQLVPTDDGALVPKITEFFPKENKMVYKIECTTLLPQFKRKQFTVLRRYEDFLWLHDRLTENKELAGVLIPHLPPKVTWVSPEPGQIAQKVSYDDGLNVKLTDQFQRRAHQLYRFLKRVCRHTLLREDIHVVVFLEYPEDIRPINHKSWFSSPWYVPRLGWADDEEGVTNRKWATHYSKQLNAVMPAAECMSLASRGLATAEVAVMQELKEWTGDHRIVLIFRQFATGLIRSQINHHLRAQIEEGLCEVLEDYVGTTAAICNMLDRCNAIRYALADSRKCRDKASVGLPPAGDPRSQTQQRKLEKLNEAFLESKLLSDSASANRVQEMEVARRRRAGDFKDTMIALCEHEIYQGKQRIQTWQDILVEVRRLADRNRTNT